MKSKDGASTPLSVADGSSPLIHRLLASPMSGPEIEAESFRIIDAEAPAHGVKLFGLRAQ